MSEERKGILKPVEIAVHRVRGFAEIDGYSTTDQDFLHRELERLGLLGPNFGYRAFDPERLAQVLENGSDRDDDILNLCLYFEIADEGIKIYDGGTELIEYMERYGGYAAQAAFVVYDMEKIDTNPQMYEQLDVLPEGEFIFKDPMHKKEAVRAVVVVEDFRTR